MSDESVCEDAVAFLRKSSDHESRNRQEALDDLRFSHGEQWPPQMQNARHLEARPFFVLNETDAYIRQITNEIRQQRPRIKAQGINSQSDAKIAQVITGIIRHIWEKSDGDNAVDTAVDHQVRMGWGYWRLAADYTRDDSFDQDICLQPVFNPFSVYFDPNSQAPDGSDAKECLITDMMPREEFRAMYPEVDMEAFTPRAAGDSTGEWLDKHNIRVAEYFRIDSEKRKLLHLSDNAIFWDDELPEQSLLDRIGVKVVGERTSYRKKVCWYKLTNQVVLDERILPGRYIPVVPVYGARLVVDGRTSLFGVTRPAKDPQRMLNYWNTAVTELVALAPKAKWLVEESSIENFEREWEMANTTAYPLLKYRGKDDAGDAIPPPQRLQPEPPPEGAMLVAQAAHDNLQRVIGMFDPAMRVGGNVSGKALNAEKQQSDLSNFHFYDNLTRSLKHTGRIMLDWIPTYYGKRRIMRIIGDDGKPDMVTVNDDQAIGKIENDLTVGEYDVVMETGPGYNSKRQEASAMMSDLAQAYPPLMQVAGDLLFRNLDFPGSDIIADRMAASNPLAQIDDKSEIPPRAQMMIKQLQAQLQQAGQQLQGAAATAKYRTDAEAVRQAGETHRMQIKEQAENQRRLLENESYMHDIHTKAQAMLGAKELEGVIKILTSHLGHEQARELAALERAANREEAKTVGTAPNSGQ